MCQNGCKNFSLVGILVDDYALGGSYKVCADADTQGSRLTVDLSFGMPEGTDLKSHGGFAVGWGLETRSSSSSEFYLSMLSQASDGWAWSGMSAKTAFSVLDMSQQPRKAFLSGLMDDPPVWK